MGFLFKSVIPYISIINLPTVVRSWGDSLQKNPNVIENRYKGRDSLVS